MRTVFKPLTKAEEEIMQVLWQQEKAFAKDLVDAMPEPRPHYNTVSTMLKILVEKGFVAYESIGKSNLYYPLVKKEEYSKKSMKQLLKGYFSGSFSEMLSFFVKEKDISVEELELLLRNMKSESKKK